MPVYTVKQNGKYFVKNWKETGVMWVDENDVNCGSFDTCEGTNVFLSTSEAIIELAKALKHISLPKDTDFVMVEFEKGII